MNTIPVQSGCFFGWIDSVLVKGKTSSSIKSNDIMELPEFYTSKKTFKEFLKIRNLLVKENSSLFRSLHQLIYKQFWVAGLYRLGSDVCVLAGPLLLNELVRAATNGDQNKKIFIAILIAISSVAQINNIQSKDTSSLQEFVVFAHNLWSCPMMIIICIIVLLKLLGWAGLVSCVLLPLLLPIESHLSKQERKARKEVLSFSDARMALLYEAIEGIRTLKFTNLCHRIYENTTNLRESELRAAWKSMRISIINSVITRSSTIVVTLCTFVVYVLVSPEPLTADRAFAALAVINILGRPIQVIPKSVSLYSEAVVALHRIEALILDAKRFTAVASIDQLVLEDDQDDGHHSVFNNTLSPIHTAVSNIVHTDAPESTSTGQTVLVLNNVTAIRPPATVVLKSVNLRLQGPGLILIVGANASGKSSLLLTILKELLDNRSRSVTGGDKKKGTRGIKTFGSGEYVGLANEENDGVTQGGATAQFSINDEDEEDDVDYEGKMRIVNQMNSMTMTGDIEIRGDDDFKTGDAPHIAVDVGSAASKYIPLQSTDERPPTSFEGETSEAEDLGGPTEAVLMAYAGHDPWILNSTARNNILISGRRPGFKYGDTGDGIAGVGSDSDRYLEAVQACALQEDFAQWPAGDETLIGEKGINISGGQKARLALARAYYSDASIVLLDSPLAALDAVVAKHVLENAIVEMAKSRLVLMTTHDSRLLGLADQIIALENGAIVFQGHPSQFDSSNLAIRGEFFGLFEYLVFPFSGSVVKPLQILTDSCFLGLFGTIELKNLNDTSDMVVKAPEKEGIPPAPPASTASVKASTSTRGEQKDSELKFKGNVYVRYLTACGLYLTTVAILLSFGAYASTAGADWILKGYTDGASSTESYLFMYGLFSSAVVLVNVARYTAYTHSGLSGSRALHKSLLEAVLGAPLSFFTATPSGKIASRFSADFDTIDFSIPGALSATFDAFLGMFTGVGVLVISSPWCILLILPLGYYYYKTQDYYRPASVQLKRLDAAARSPLFTHFSEVLSGLECVRGYQIQKYLCQQHHDLLDTKIRARLNWDAANRWLGIRLDMIGAMIISVAAFAVAFSGASGGVAGLMLAYATKATNSLSFAVRSFAAMENMFTSAERVLAYLEVEQEVSKQAVHRGHPPLHASPDYNMEIKDMVASQRGVRLEPSSSGSVSASTATSARELDRSHRGSEIELSPQDAGSETKNPLAIQMTTIKDILLDATDELGAREHDFVPHESKEDGKDVAMIQISEERKEGIQDIANIVLETRELSARYSPSLPLAIIDISFKLPAGRIIGICGRSGCGKSTLTMTLARAIQDVFGDVFLLGSDYKRFPLNQYRSLIQVYPQDLYVFSGKLRDILDPEHKRTDLALRQLLSSLTSVVRSSAVTDSGKESRPNGSAVTAAADIAVTLDNTMDFDLDYKVSSGGGNLSAGQKQVVCLCRAALALSSTAVLILDECCAHMDEEGGRRTIAVFRALLEEELLRDENVSLQFPKCILMIGHRLRDVAMCDEVLLMAEGRVIERGTPGELLKTSGGKFADMAALQGVYGT